MQWGKNKRWAKCSLLLFIFITNYMCTGHQLYKNRIPTIYLRSKHLISYIVITNYVSNDHQQVKGQWTIGMLELTTASLTLIFTFALS